VNELPDLINPLSMKLNGSIDSSKDLTMCIAESKFSQITTSPVLIFIIYGEKQELSCSHPKLYEFAAIFTTYSDEANVIGIKEIEIIKILIKMVNLN
tara:strand:+ start:1104 stop:1394 length:291 start_codon:yes stop_codon:yes gene_type:complete